MAKLETESTVSLDKWFFRTLGSGLKTLRDVADNIDLFMVLNDYEEYFELRFQRPAKLVKKIAESAVLPKIQKKGSGSLVSGEKKGKGRSYYLLLLLKSL